MAAGVGHVPVRTLILDSRKSHRSAPASRPNGNDSPSTTACPGWPDLPAACREFLRSAASRIAARPRLGIADLQPVNHTTDRTDLQRFRPGGDASETRAWLTFSPLTFIVMARPDHATRTHRTRCQLSTTGPSQPRFPFPFDPFTKNERWPPSCPSMRRRYSPSFVAKTCAVFCKSFEPKPAEDFQPRPQTKSRAVRVLQRGARCQGFPAVYHRKGCSARRECPAVDSLVELFLRSVRGKRNQRDDRKGQTMTGDSLHSFVNSALFDSVWRAILVLPASAR